jgi:hypothetical protein
VRNPGEITGQLEIDFGEFLATPNLLPAEILVDGAFQISPPNCNLRIEIEGDVPSEPIKSTTCLVTPARTDDTFFDASRLISKLDGCGLGPWQLLVYGKVSQLTGALEANGLPAEFSVETVGTPANIETRCNQSLESAIAISTSQTSSDLRSEVRIRLVKRGDIAIAILFALVMTMLVSLVSLLLLRVLNILMAKTVDGNSFFAYEADAEIESDRSGVSSLQWSDLSVTTKNYVANPDRLEPVRTNRSRTELKAGDLTFERQLPSIFRPFAEPRLKLISAKPAIFWQSNSQRDGLPLTFAKAIVITRVGTNDVVLRSSSKVRFTVIVPRRGIGSGFSGAEELVRDKAEKLAGDLGIELANQVDKAAGKNQADLSENASARETKTGDMAKVPSAKLPPTNAPMPPSPHPIRSFSSEPPMPPS